MILKKLKKDDYLGGARISKKLREQLKKDGVSNQKIVDEYLRKAYVIDENGNIRGQNGRRISK